MVAATQTLLLPYDDDDDAYTPRRSEKIDRGERNIGICIYIYIYRNMTLPSTLLSPAVLFSIGRSMTELRRNGKTLRSGGLVTTTTISQLSPDKLTYT